MGGSNCNTGPAEKLVERPGKEVLSAGLGCLVSLVEYMQCVLVSSCQGSHLLEKGLLMPEKVQPKCEA